MARFSKLQVKDVELGAVQQNVADALEPLLRNALLDGVLTDEVTVATTATHVAHRLGRRPRGWLVVAPQADARVWGQPLSGLEDKLLSLTASAAVTLRLWVF